MILYYSISYGYFQALWFDFIQQSRENRKYYSPGRSIGGQYND